MSQLLWLLIWTFLGAPDRIFEAAGKLSDEVVEVVYL